MVKRKYIQYSSIVIFSIFLIHFFYSGLLAIVTSKFYQHRIISLAKFEPRCWNNGGWRAMAKSFINDQILASEKPVIIVIGSSFSWGYAWPERDVYSYKLEKVLDAYRVVNFSIIGLDGGNYVGLLRLLKQANIKVDKLIIEMSIGNWPKFLAPDDPNDIPFFLEKIGMEASYFSYYLSHFFGFNALKLIKDEHNYSQTERTFSNVKLRPDYFPNINQVKASLAAEKEGNFLDKIFALSTEVANDVYFFVAPIAMDSIATQSIKQEILQELKFINVTCKKSGNIHCLEPSLPDNNFYYDVSHLNIKGHTMFAAWLSREIQKKITKLDSKVTAR